jgi:hypothetical protein
MAFDCLFKLDRAAKLASTHAGREVTPHDFVEAAARGQIPLVAICPRAVTMEPCRETDKPLVVAEHGLPPLPLAACQKLQVNGHANWRTIDGVEQIKSGMFEGQLGRFDRWKLPEAEFDISITLDDCRVLGYVIHALADSSFDKPAPAPSAALPAPAVQVAEASRVPGFDVDAQADGFIDESVPAPDQSAALPGPVARSVWSLKNPMRYRGYTAPLYRLLAAAKRDGQLCPTARDVVEEWRIKQPPEVAMVLTDNIDYYDIKGNTKNANLAAIRKAIKRMTKDD